MGRIVDLCGEIAAAAEEGRQGLVLAPEDWERLSGDFTEDEIEDALSLVHESLLEGELVEAADSLNTRLLAVLGGFGGEAEFALAAKGEARLSLEAIGQLARRVERLEGVLVAFRDGEPPDRSGFDRLRRRLMDHGIETEMRSEDEPPPRGETEDTDEDEDE